MRVPEEPLPAAPGAKILRRRLVEKKVNSGAGAASEFALFVLVSMLAVKRIETHLPPLEGWNWEKAWSRSGCF